MPTPAKTPGSVGPAKFPVRKVVSGPRIRAKVAAILAEFPALKGYDPTESCCAGCASADVGRELGWAAASAWDELQSLNLLLGCG